MQLEGQVEQTQLQKELDILLEIERSARQNNQLELSLSNVKEVLGLLFSHGDLELIKKTVVSLCDKKSQPIKTVTEIIKQAIQFLQGIQRDEDRVDFAEVLFKITDQKIYVEKEHSQLCLLLVESREK